MTTNIENAIPFGDDALVLVEMGLFKVSSKIQYVEDEHNTDNYNGDGAYKQYNWEFRAIYRLMHNRGFLIYTYSFLNDGKFISPSRIVKSIQSLMDVDEIQDELFTFLYQPHYMIHLGDGDYEGEVYFSCAHYNEFPPSFEEVIRYNDDNDNGTVELFLPIDAD